MPFINHPKIAGKHADHIPEILAYALFRYLTFTINLELIVVNRTTKRLLAGSCGISLDSESRLNAMRLYCDEAYHALFCADMLVQAQRLTGFDHQAQQPAFLNKIRELDHNSQLYGIETLLFTVVSETLITANLMEIRQGEHTPKAITSLMLDHAMDEARHHAFYKDVLYQLFRISSVAQKSKLAALLPEFILAFTRPDTNSMMADLKAVGLCTDDADEILADTYAKCTITSYAKACAKDLVSSLDELNVFHVPEVQDAFCRAGL